MAKRKVVVGQVLKGKDGKGSYLKISNDVKLTKGQIVQVQSPKEQLAQAKLAFADGKISEELMEKIEERVDKTPDFVLKEIFYFVEKGGDENPF